jgi:hypothetical protein
MYKIEGKRKKCKHLGKSYARKCFLLSSIKAKLVEIK